jgi:hypothetical protein
MFQPKQIIRINLIDCADWTEVAKIMKEYNIEKYTYTFGCKEGVLKHGLSRDIKSQIGDRIYRQSGHLEGWSGRLKSQSGSDMRIIADDYREKYGKTLDRKDVWIQVYDFTNAQDPDLEIELHEEYLIRESINASNGNAPIGNKDYKTKRRTVKAKNTIKAKELFEGFDDEELA